MGVPTLNDARAEILWFWFGTALSGLGLPNLVAPTYQGSASLIISTLVSSLSSLTTYHGL